MNNKRFFYFGILVLIISGFLMNRYYRKREVIKYKAFYQANISGELYSISATGSGIHIVLEGTEEKFTFSPYTSSLNGNKIFSSFAKKGDKVIKTPFSDTLKLLKNNTTYLYTFRKYE